MLRDYYSHKLSLQSIILEERKLILCQLNESCATIARHLTMAIVVVNSEKSIREKSTSHLLPLNSWVLRHYASTIRGGNRF